MTFNTSCVSSGSSTLVGRLFQNPAVGTAPNMTIEENLTLACKAGSWISHITREDREFYRQKLAALEMGLEDRLNRQVGTLSGGQRQALALMIATINPPKLLLLDEHTAVLDPAAAEKILQITKQIVEDNNLTCLMITHDMQSALEMGNRTIMMNRGKIIYDVSGRERENITVNTLLEKFHQAVGRQLSDDEILLK